MELATPSAIPDRAPTASPSFKYKSVPSKRYGTVSRYERYGPPARAVYTTSMTAVPTALTVQVAGGVNTTMPPS
jgi:hypothetical protein